MSDATPKKLLFLGDSFTVGTGLGAGHEQEAFPYQLKARLEAQSASIAEPTLYAVDGDTAADLLAALGAAAGMYDMVSLCIGINDVYRGHALADYRRDFDALLECSLYFADHDPARVIALSIPAWDASPSVEDGSGPKARAEKYEAVRRRMTARPGYNSREGIAAEIDAFNAAARALAAGRGIRFIDITDLTRSDCPDPSLFTADGIHYSGKMYARWAERLLPTVQRLLEHF